MKILSLDDYSKLKVDLKNGDRNKLISFVNAFSYYDVINHHEMCDKFDGFFSDGLLLTKLHNIFNPKNMIDRVSFDFSSISDDFFLFCQRNNYKVSIIGAKEDELQTTLAILKNKYTDLLIGNCSSGYYSNSEEDKIIKSVEDSDIAIVAMGAPIQEKLATKLNESNEHRLVITCGGFITQTSIREDYYFPIVKKLGLRWLQRLVFHKHVRDKVFKNYPRFVVKYLFDNVKQRL